MNYIEKAIKIGLKHLRPILGCHHGEGTVPGDAGIADHAVKSAVLFNILFEFFAALLTVSDIKLQQIAIFNA